MITRPVIAGIGETLWDVYPDDAHFGGAPANFACHAASLGAEAWMISAVGMDELGADALLKLRERGVNCDHVKRDPDHATGRVLVNLDSSGQPSYQFASDTAWDHLRWSEDMTALAERCDAVCFGTLAQRSAISREAIRQFLAATSDHTLRVLDVNLRQRFYDTETIRASLELASVVKLNDEELPVVSELCGLRATTSRDRLIELMRQFDLRLAALTRGAHGSLLMAAGGVEDECPATPTRLVDTVGAGDAFTATLVCGFLRGQPLDVINRRANAVAAYVCSQAGATPPLPAALLDDAFVKTPAPRPGD